VGPRSKRHGGKRGRPERGGKGSFIAHKGSAAVWARVVVRACVDRRARACKCDAAGPGLSAGSRRRSCAVTGSDTSHCQAALTPASHAPLRLSMYPFALDGIYSGSEGRAQNGRHDYNLLNFFPIHLCRAAAGRTCRQSYAPQPRLKCKAHRSQAHNACGRACATRGQGQLLRACAAAARKPLVKAEQQSAAACACAPPKSQCTVSPAEGRLVKGEPRARMPARVSPPRRAPMRVHARWPRRMGGGRRSAAQAGACCGVCKRAPSLLGLVLPYRMAGIGGGRGSRGARGPGQRE
jgi:hypothetical protein